MNVSFSQIALFNAGLQNPFNNWSDLHVAQGFSWREGSVSFKTLIESGPIDVTFSLAHEFGPNTDAIRAISVPFLCDKQGSVEISTIIGGHRERLSAGPYQIVFETGLDGSYSWCRFTAIPRGNLLPQILVSDRGLAPCYPLLMEVTPA